MNTHHHGDHTYGNGVFTPEALILGHDNARAEQLAAGHQLEMIWPTTDFGAMEIVPPDLTYNDRTTLHVGDIEVRIIHPGVAHTTGDSLVWLPGQRVVFTGDLVFAGGTPSWRWARCPARCGPWSCCAPSTRRPWSRATGR